MTQPRLIALLLLYIHKDIQIDYETVTNIYAAKDNRRMLLNYPHGDAD